MQNPQATEVIQPPPLWLLVFITALAPITMNGVLPANTAVMHDLNTTYSSAQMVLSIYLVASMLAQVILGNLADRIGRRPVMIGGLLVFFVGSIVCGLATNIEWLWLGRFIQGFGSAVCVFLTRTILRDVHPKDKAASAIGYMVTAMMIAPIFGPALFGWLTDISSWRIMYAVLAASALALAVLCQQFQPETLREELKPKHSSLQSNFELMKAREFCAYVLIMCGSVGIYYCYLAAAPYVVMELRNHTATQYGVWFSMVAIGYLCGNFFAGRHSEKYGTRRMIVLSMIPLLIGITLFWLLSGVDHLLGLFLPMQLVSFSHGVCLPNLTSAAMSVKEEMAGAASGLLGTIQIATAILLTIALSVALKSSELPMFLAITLCGVVAAFGLLVLLKSPNTH